MNVTVNGKEVDLTKCFPLTLGDWEDMGDKGVRPQDLSAPTFKTTRIFLTTVLRKGNAEITDDDLRSLTLEELTEINTAVGGAMTGGTVNRPFSNTSTPSEDTTGGQPPT